MTWKPISESEIQELVNASYERMTLQQRRLWDVIKIMPHKWQQEPWGNEGGGFWVIAIVGDTVIWYNDIEEGFNRSKYEMSGYIKNYWCNQDELEQTIQQILNEIETGVDSSYRLFPPIKP